jgi:hypothetical protein
LQQDAVSAGLTVSGLVRRRYFGRRIVARADTAMLHELRRQGGLLKHLMGSSMSHDEDIQRTLRSIETAVVRFMQEGMAPT